MLEFQLAVFLLHEIIFVNAENTTNETIPRIIQESHLNEKYLESARRILFVMFCLFAGVAVNFQSKKYHYPYTVGCFIFGVIIGVLETNSQFVKNFTHISRMIPNDLLLIFLPILIFESSFSMNAHMFYKALPQCFLLAGLGFLLCAAIIAAYAKLALHSYGWSWLTALVFGSIVSATDPVAVVALLKDMRLPHSFTVLIEGESLVNDGLAVVLYELLLHLMVTEMNLNVQNISIQILKTCIGAPGFGYILGKLSEWMLSRMYINPVCEMTITLVLPYIVYLTAEHIFEISAVLAVVSYGVTLSSNRMCMSPESECLIDTSWRLLTIYANTLIFMIVGILIAGIFTDFFDSTDAWLILVTYIVLTILRGLMVALFYPILRNIGYGLTWKESIILSWGGLRGAIGLALSLMFATDPYLPDSVNAQKSSND